MSRVIETTIGALGDYINGRGFKPSEWGKVGLPIVRIANLNNPKAPYDYFSGALSAGHLIDTGDIIVSWSASLDAFRWNRGQAALNQHSFKVIPNGTLVDADYLFYVLKMAMVGLSDLVHGATMKHVTRPEFEGFQVWIRSDKNEQRQIASRLKAQLAEVETARQAVQVQLRDAGLLRQRLLQQAFDAMADVPHKVLGNHANITSGVTPARDNSAYWQPAEIPWVKTGEIDFAPITTVQESISKKALEECSLSLLPPKTVLVAITGEGKTRGRSAVLEVSATTNQHSVSILPNDTWDAYFLQLWMQSSYHDLRELSEGRGGSRSALSGGQIKALEIPAPDIEEQRRVVAHLKQQLAEADALHAALEDQQRDLDAMPKRILAQAFEN